MNSFLGNVVGVAFQGFCEPVHGRFAGRFEGLGALSLGGKEGVASDFPFLAGSDDSVLSALGDVFQAQLLGFPKGEGIHGGASFLAEFLGDGV